MILLGAHQLAKSFGTRSLFKSLTFSIEGGERIGLIGPNGAGKSTLLRILAGQIDADEGRLTRQKGLRVGLLEQVPAFAPSASIHSTILEGSHDAHDWQQLAKAEEIIAKLALSKWDPHMPVSQLSGGWKKRVALARELLREPDLLLLDEPTNHFDIESIIWLENLLSQARFATLTITHDRLFLQRIANRILELDSRHDGGLLSVAGDYASFLEARAALLAAQERQESKLKNTLRRETEWLRRGPKARQAKQRARMDAADRLAEDVEELNARNRNANVRLDFQNTEKTPKKLIEVKDIAKSYGGQIVIPRLNLVIGAKSRIGLIGSNGCGKSTLIRLLTQTEQPDQGSVFHAERLKISYFEQNRETLDPALSVFKTVCPLGDYVDYAGQSVHAKGYLSRFLFAYDQMDQPVSKLSGGEQSRLLLARLMLKEANLLVLDEPTNDLDISTLDVLADVLQEFKGAILLVSHDRYFLDLLTTQILAFGHDENGEKAIVPMVGLNQWEEWHQHQLRPSSKAKSADLPLKTETAAAKRKKLSYVEQRELDTIEGRIEAAETRLNQLIDESTRLGGSGNSQRLLDLSKELAAAQAEVEGLYSRWAELTS